MAQQFRIQRTYRKELAVANSFALIDLPRGYDYESIYIRVEGGVEVTSLCGAPRLEAPSQIISRVEVVADGRNTLHSAPFWHYVLGHHDRLGYALGVVGPTSGVVATYPISCMGPVDFFTPDGVRPKDSNFRTDGLQLFQLRLTFGQANDLFDNSYYTDGQAVFTPGTFVEITTSEIVELPDPATNTRTTPVALKKISFQELTVPSSNANQEIRLPAGNMIKSVLLRTSNLAEPSADYLQNVQAFSGVDVRLNMSAKALDLKNRVDFVAYKPPGYYVLDFAHSGAGGPTASMSELWNVTNQAEPKVSMDIIGGAGVKVQAVVTEYIGLK